MESVMLTILFLLVYAKFRSRIDETNLAQSRLHIWNLVLLILALCACLCLSIVAIVSLNVQYTVHSYVAVIGFAFMVIQILLFYLIISHHLRYSATQSALHLTAIVMCIPLNITILIVATIVYFTCSTVDCLQYVYNSFPVVEYITAIGILVYVYSFRGDLQNWGVGAMENRDTMNNNDMNDGNSNNASDLSQLESEEEKYNSERWLESTKSVGGIYFT